MSHDFAARMSQQGSRKRGDFDPRKYPSVRARTQSDRNKPPKQSIPNRWIGQGDLFHHVAVRTMFAGDQDQHRSSGIPSRVPPQLECILPLWFGRTRKGTADRYQN